MYLGGRISDSREGGYFMQIKTIVVGGGIAGMSCAMRLLETGQDFMLITDELGGRVKYVPKENLNFGAYFVMGNYTYAKKILAAGAPIKPTDVCFHNSETERFAVISPHTLSRLPEFVRFFLAMREFSSHYEPYKQRCLTMPQKSALQADPYLADLFSKPASQFIQEKKYEKVASDYISKFTYACTGASTDYLTALDFLNVSMGMIVPIHRIQFDQQAMIQKLGDRLVIDTIDCVDQHDGQHLLSGISGKAYQAENIVIATPAVVTQQLLHLAEIREACKLYVFHVKADLKPNYRQYEMNLFPYTAEFMLTARQLDGSYLIYSRERNADLRKICENCELLSTQAWEKAMYVHGKAYIEQQYGDGLYVAGDHNGLGLEPAAISGIFAANQIIHKTPGMPGKKGGL
jgi:hypothetical protein